MQNVITIDTDSDSSIERPHRVSSRPVPTPSSTKKIAPLNFGIACCHCKSYITRLQVGKFFNCAFSHTICKLCLLSLGETNTCGKCIQVKPLKLKTTFISTSDYKEKYFGTASKKPGDMSDIQFGKEYQSLISHAAKIPVFSSGSSSKLLKEIRSAPKADVNFKILGNISLEQIPTVRKQSAEKVPSKPRRFKIKCIAIEKEEPSMDTFVSKALRKRSNTIAQTELDLGPNEIGPAINEKQDPVINNLVTRATRKKPNYIDQATSDLETNVIDQQVPRKHKNLSPSRQVLNKNDTWIPICKPLEIKKHRLEALVTEISDMYSCQICHTDSHAQEKIEYYCTATECGYLQKEYSCQLGNGLHCYFNGIKHSKYSMPGIH